MMLTRLSADCHWCNKVHNCQLKPAIEHARKVSVVSNFEFDRLFVGLGGSLMKGNDFLKLLGVVVAGYFAVRLAFWALHLVVGILSMLLSVAIVVGIIWVIMQLTTKKRNY